MENYIWPVITEDTTIEELQEIHKCIWQYVVDNDRKPSTPYTQDCVACEYNLQFNFDEHFATCEHCPIAWGEPNPCCRNSLYWRWATSYTPTIRRMYAEQIRDIPFKGGSENV